MNDFPGRMNHDLPTSPESLLIGGPIQENKDKVLAACPLMYISKDDATCLIIHGDHDPLVPYDQSVQFHKQLKAAGVEATLIKMVNGEHGGFRSAEQSKRIENFLRRHLLNQSDVNVSPAPISVGND